MKFQSRTYAAKQRKIGVQTTSGEEIVLTVSPLPPEFLEKEAQEIPEPSVPHEMARQPGTGRLLKDDKGQPQIVPAENDPKYQRKLFRMMRARTARIIHHGLRDEAEIEWDTKKEDFPEVRNFYFALAEEMDAFGLAFAQQTNLAQLIQQMSGFNLEDAKSLAYATFRDEDGEGDGECDEEIESTG